ncbi:stage II sporulation protein M [Chamaesiphon sp. VAR_48_metabat_403]|uniref:stage II sporulation protein M n=1 Tax=Chamaesiphon sp. VAR_48_metabat_403 TaxID=2964700 RepID=UPI00286D88C2|nr:stage II sporulation protein M [Chamaesiphon sp. VAR_48_metabat_403]
MNIQRWIARRQGKWQELDKLLLRAQQRGIKSLNAKEIATLASLYRSVAADLARANTNQIGQTIVQELQALTTRGYSQIYRGSRRQELRGAIDFYLWKLPQVLRETWGYTAIAFAIFLIGGLIAWWFAWQDASFMSLVVPQSMIEKVRDRNQLWMGSIIGTEPFAASSIAINNLSVAFRMVAGGILAGFWTIYALFYNGVLIGAVATLVGQNGLAYPFWAFVFPHGALELPAIFIAGGGGLLIARGLLFPGRHRRRDALRIYGGQAAQLVMGIFPMLLIAGAIEGFFSPQEFIPSPFKYLAGTGLFILLILYTLRRDVPEERLRQRSQEIPSN